MRPILFSFLHFDVHAAPAFAGLSSLAAYLYFRSQRNNLKLTLDDFWNLILALMVGVFLGSVIIYAVLYGNGLADNIRFVRQAHVIKGGSFFGVFWGAVAAAFLFCRIKKVDFAPVADVLGAATALGLVFMRMGCLLNGCCYGRPTQMPWGIVFRDRLSGIPHEFLGVPLHPSQIYEAAGALGIFLLLHFVVLCRRDGSRLKTGSAFLLFIASYALLRFGTDFLRASDPGMVRIGGLSTAQLIALLSLAAVGAVWRFRSPWRSQGPGR
jgi:phosphatidylglycerol:prolipoprotein diacylglycerol transferase